MTVTRDVIFYENIFPFTWHKPSQVHFPVDSNFIELDLDQPPSIPTSNDVLPVV